MPATAMMEAPFLGAWLIGFQSGRIVVSFQVISYYRPHRDYRD
jgi:hypothetical protein